MAMTTILTQGRELYAALAGGDIATLRRLLAPDFQGQLSEGLPHGFGRHYQGLEAMLQDGWGGIGEWFKMSPHPQDMFDVGRVLIARGDYVGIARASGKPISAAFAHFWAYDGAQFTGVTQVTDTGLWRDALATT